MWNGSTVLMSAPSAGPSSRTDTVLYSTTPSATSSHGPKKHDVDRALGGSGADVLAAPSAPRRHSRRVSWYTNWPARDCRTLPTRGSCDVMRSAFHFSAGQRSVGAFVSSAGCRRDARASTSKAAVGIGNTGSDGGFATATR